MSRVLVVEDEETLRNAMVRGLAKLSGVEALGAGSIAEALTVVDGGAPDVVVSDLDLPDRPGLELIGELGRRGIRCPITFVSAYVRAFSAQIPRHAGVRVLEKPVPLERLRELVQADLAQRGEGSTRPPPFGVAEYMQIACLGGHSVRITVRGGRSKAAIGEVIVHRGALWSARDAASSGIDAFRRLLFSTSALVEAHAMTGEPGPRTSVGPGEAALRDAARAADENRRDGIEDDLLADLTVDLDELEPPPLVLSAPLEPAPEPELDAFEQARERGASALLERDYAAAYEALSEAERIRPGDRTVEANLVRLRQMGFGIEEGGSE